MKERATLLAVFLGFCIAIAMVFYFAVSSHTESYQIEPTACPESVSLYDDSVSYVAKDTAIGIAKLTNIQDTMRYVYFTGHEFSTIDKCLWVPEKDTCQLKSCYLDWQSNHIRITEK